VVSIALISLFPILINFSNGYADEKESDDFIRITLLSGPYSVERSSGNHEIKADGFGRLLIPGKPDLPSRIFSVAIPPGAVVTGVTFELCEGEVLPGMFRVPPVSLPWLIGIEDSLISEREKRKYEENYKAAYGTDDPYPKSISEFVRGSGYRKYNLVDVRITPFRYNPLSGRLTHYSEVTVVVNYSKPGDGLNSNIKEDNLPRTERVARDIISNYDEAQQWYSSSGVCEERGKNDFVIITLESLVSAVTLLTDWEETKGRTAQVVTIEWIDSNYPGIDLAEKVRNFLRDKYPSEEWGIEDVLLVGHYDDIPMRQCAQDIGGGNPYTDYYYAELSLHDSLSWDADGDLLYGETGDDQVDFYTEVNVGRIPWSDFEIVERICNKSVDYEQNSDRSFKKNILLLGAYFWSHTDNAVLMEYVADPDLHPWMADWTKTRMYEQNDDYWSEYDCDYPLFRDNVRDVWSAGKYGFVNWAGHGSPFSSHILGILAPAFIVSSDCPLLNDNFPAIICAEACSNLDPKFKNIGQSMMKQGAVGFLGATKASFGANRWDHPDDGSSQTFDYFFTKCVTSGDYTQGQAHQWALREMYTQGLWYTYRYETFEWGSLFGNPDLGMAMNNTVIVVDNSSSDFSIVEGSWEREEHPDANYDDLVFVKDGSAGRGAAWRVDELLEPGTYEVYTWKFEHDWMNLMSTETPYKVFHRDGVSDWILVDQSLAGNDWIYLGTFEFDNSSTQGILVTDSEGGAVIADAIKLVNTVL
jgi:hypothetical protein